MKKLILVLLTSCMLFLVGCSTNKESKSDKVKREIELYNSNVARVIDNYELCYNKVNDIETELLAFLITLKPNKELGEAVPVFKDRKSLVDFIGLDYSMSEYSLNICKDNSEDFAKYIEGYTVKDSDVEYFMDSSTGNLYMYITYYNIDSRVLNFEIVWNNGEIASIISGERGESTNEEEYENFY